MSSDIRNMIGEFIKKFKNSKELNKAYYEFDLFWLKHFDEKNTNNVIIEYECVKNQRIYGANKYNYMVLNDFIKSLEKLLEDTI